MPSHQYSVQPFDSVPFKVLDNIIAGYCPVSEPRILDATLNKGRIWGSKKSKDRTRYKYTGMDIDSSVRPHLVGDNTAMPFGDNVFDIVVYDPPHTGDQGKTTFAKKYGVGVKSKNGNLFHTYPPFLSEAARVLKPSGLLLVKLIDCTHSGTVQFATAEFWNAARFQFELRGLTMLPRKSVIIDPKWKKAYHPRQNHCTWMTFTKTSANYNLPENRKGRDSPLQRSEGVCARDVENHDDDLLDAAE